VVVAIAVAVVVVAVVASHKVKVLIRKRALRTIQKIQQRIPKMAQRAQHIAAVVDVVHQGTMSLQVKSSMKMA
jgi:predicted ArsR family transcriptional regulator